MSNAMDRLFDLLEGRPTWTIPPTPATLSLTSIKVTEEMSILPDTPNGPMLQISKKNPEGVVMYVEKLNLPAVDDLIGRLIKMRDLIAAMTPEKPDV